MIHRYSVLFIALLVLGGCVVTQPKVITYSNPNILTENKERQWLIDKGECTQAQYEILLPTIETTCPGSGYSAGYCKADLRTKHREIRQEIFDGCMAKKGYKKEVSEIKE